MKKTVIILSTVLALVACNKETVEQKSISQYTYEITITRADDTKAVKSAWESGDVVYVFFSDVAAPKYLKFTYGGTEWSSVQYNGDTAESFAYPGTGTMTAIYLPYGNDAVVSADGTSFKFDETFTSYFLKAEKAAYTVSGTTVSGTLKMEAPEGFVQFAMPLSGTINETETIFFRNTCTYTLSNSNLKPVSFASVAADGSINVDDSANEGDPITGYIYNGDINFSGVLKSTVNGIAADYEFTFVNKNGEASYDDVTYILSGNKTFSYKDAIKFPTIDNSAWKVPEPGYVEIKGVKWAKWNIGASTEGGYGDYFTWGATYPQATYSYDDYRESSIDADLTAAKDIAYQKLGSSWHMPTQDEINSIFGTSSPFAPAEGVTWNWISTSSLYGTVGFEVYETSTPANKIFLPLAGYRTSGINNAGLDGYYWSSKLGGTNSGRNFTIWGGDHRSWGF